MSHDEYLGDDMWSEETVNPTPLYPQIEISQVSIMEVLALANLEIRTRDFPLDEKAIRELVGDMTLFGVTLQVNGVLRGWCIFHAEEKDLYVDRLSVLPHDDLDLHLEAIFKSITYTPKTSPLMNPKVTVVWPLHERDRPVFQALIAGEWKANGLESNRFEGYGQSWDGVKLERQF